jgi:hypothetical protein
MLSSIISNLSIQLLVVRAKGNANRVIEHKNTNNETNVQWSWLFVECFASMSVAPRATVHYQSEISSYVL